MGITMNMLTSNMLNIFYFVVELEKQGASHLLYTTTLETHALVWFQELFCSWNPRGNAPFSAR